MRETCMDCRFFDRLGGGGMCRLNPPTTILVNGEVETAWPFVGALDWCGALAPAAGQREHGDG